MASFNAYAALVSDDEDTPAVEPVIKKQPKASATPKSKPVTKVAPVESVPVPDKKPITARATDSRPDRRPRTGQGKDESHPARQNGETRPHYGDGPARHERGEEGDRKFGGRGSRRVDGERVYDRQSGTGRGREVKKQGGGSRNWGLDKEDQSSLVVEAEPNPAEEELAIPETTEEISASVPVEVEPEEEIDLSITLEEFQARLKAEREAAAEIFGPVQEKSVDQSEFTGGKLRQKEAVIPEAFVSGRADNGDAKKTAKAKKVKQTFVDVGFTAPPIERGGRGGDRRDSGRGRGRGRGDRPYRTPYANSGSHQNIDVNDVSSFPKL